MGNKRWKKMREKERENNNKKKTKNGKDKTVENGFCRNIVVFVGFFFCRSCCFVFAVEWLVVVMVRLNKESF